MQSHAKNLPRIESEWILREGVSFLISNISCTKQSNLLLHFLRTENYTEALRLRATDATTPNNVVTCSASWEGYSPQVFVNHLQWACVAPTMLEELCKRIQHCCATLRRSRNKRYVGSCWLKSLTGFNLCATTRNNIQQHATGCANGHKM